MTPTWDCTEARLSLGVYVLGAIDPAERALVDAHLLTCEECRDELAGLAGLPALLARVNPDEISRIRTDDTVGSNVPAAAMVSNGPAASGGGTEDRPPGELIGTVLDLAQARRRRGRWRLAAAAAAVVAIAGGLAGGLSSISTTRVIKVPLSPGTSQWETVQAVSKISGASASVAYAHEQWGDAYAVLVDHIPVGTTCELWIVHPDGTRTLAGSWTTAPDEGKVWYSGSTAATDKAASSYQITSGRQVLLTAKPV
jgi:anti-sigma factor RsiW